MVNGIVSLISLSDSLLLVYRNARDYCVLIFYPVNLPNPLMGSSSFLVVSLGLCMYSVMSSTNRQFYIFFSSLDSFYFFIFSDCHARISETMLNNSGGSGHPCLVPDLRGNAFSFHHWEWCLLWICHLSPLLCWGMFHLCPLSGETFLKIINGSWILGLPLKITSEVD